MSLKERWDKIQDFLDVRGDVVMLGYTAAIVYKTIFHGLNPSDACAYSAAIGSFGYSKSQKYKKDDNGKT